LIGYIFRKCLVPVSYIFLLLSCMHQPIQPKSLSRWKKVDNSFILQHSPLLVGSLPLGFELKTSDFDTILNYMHQPIQLKSLRYVWFGFQPAVAFTKSQKPTKGSGCGRKPPPKAAFSLFKIKKIGLWGALARCGCMKFEEIIHCH